MIFMFQFFVSDYSKRKQCVDASKIFIVVGKTFRFSFFSARLFCLKEKKQLESIRFVCEKEKLYSLISFVLLIFYLSILMYFLF